MSASLSLCVVLDDVTWLRLLASMSTTLAHDRPPEDVASPRTVEQLAAGVSVGEWLGAGVGTSVGVCDGEGLGGFVVGFSVGVWVGEGVGVSVGTGVGDGVGTGVGVGVGGVGACVSRVFE